MSDRKNVFAAIERATGVHAKEVKNEETRHYLEVGVMRILFRPKWKRPAEIEKEIEGIRSDIRRLKKRIIAADPYALSLARRQATHSEEMRLFDEIELAAGNEEKIDEISDRYLTLMESISPDEYVDTAAIVHLESLEKGLVRPIEAAIEAAPHGRGRPQNVRAHQIALYAAKSYWLLTGEKPTFWNGTDNSFSQLVKELFAIGGVVADIRKPIESAMSKFDQEEGI